MCVSLGYIVITAPMPLLIFSRNVTWFYRRVFYCVLLALRYLSYCLYIFLLLSVYSPSIHHVINTLYFLSSHCYQTLRIIVIKNVSSSYLFILLVLLIFQALPSIISFLHWDDGLHLTPLGFHLPTLLKWYNKSL